MHTARILALFAVASSAIGQMALPPDGDGYLLHRGSGDNAEAVVASAGGVGLQEKSYELRSWLPEFVLIHRSGKTYLIDDPATVRQAWRVWAASLACLAGVDAATPTVEELQSALAACQANLAEASPGEAAAQQKVRDSLVRMEIAVAQRLRERSAPDTVWTRRVLELILQSRMWNTLDAAISSGVARPIEK
jgi:hypothetical protein